MKSFPVDFKFVTVYLYVHLFINVLTMVGGTCAPFVVASKAGFGGIWTLTDTFLHLHTINPGWFDRDGGNLRISKPL